MYHGASLIERNENIAEVNRWLNRLKALESSFGGAGPKAYSIDEEAAFWIAKLLSKNDTIDKSF
ncbi:MAG TPA: hypothetical protein VFQ86_08705 [Arachidicoccus soli]|nr:hypothetical protein [Arachidicoccus soli]